MCNIATISRNSGILAAAIVFGTSAFSTHASAQPNACGHRSQFVEMLGKKYSEAPVSMGLATNGNVVEVFSAVDGSSWTLLMTMPDGRSCLVASGESWMSVTQISGQAS